MEKEFPISNYPLEQTEFLYDSKQGMVISDITVPTEYDHSLAKKIYGILYTDRYIDHMILYRKSYEGVHEIFPLKITEKHVTSLKTRKILSSIILCSIIGKGSLPFVCWKMATSKIFGNPNTALSVYFLTFCMESIGQIFHLSLLWNFLSYSDMMVNSNKTLI